MYKLLLCWRYLLTRYLALACIISVMLGVATLIVVNSVMSGFSTKLKDRLHGLLSDVIMEATSIEGFSDPRAKMERILQDPVLSQQIEAMAPTMEMFAMLQFRLPNGEMMTRTVRVIGVEPKSRSAIGGFKEYLVWQKNQAEPSFEPSAAALKNYRFHMQFLMPSVANFQPLNPNEPPPPEPPQQQLTMPCGAIVGNLIATMRHKDKGETEYKEYQLVKPGDTVILTTLSGQRLMPVYDSFMVVDYFKSEMSEYDQNYIFVPLHHLQHLRTMEDRVTSIQFKLKPDVNPVEFKERLAALLPASPHYQIVTWQEKQSPLLGAIAIEKGILNVLLFLIIGVAGFGILAIFSMIVAVKTRDIGILKALGASNVGVMKIFLTYGLLLGLVGTGLGTLLGMTLTIHINEVEQFLSSITGQEIFDRSIYYFTEIPTDIQLWNVVFVNVGAVAIAVLFSVLPALRAAMLHPVRALRYE